MRFTQHSLKFRKRSRSLAAEKFAWAAAAALLATVPAAAGVDDGLETHVVVKADRVITVTGEEFAPGTIVITDGKVALVGGDVDYPGEARVIDASGHVVMPGFVLPRTRYGLSGYSRKGVHGDQNVATEVYLDHMNFDDLLEAGYTTVCYVPAGQGISGMAAAFRSAGPQDQRALGDSSYLNAPLSWRGQGGGKKLLRGALKKAKAEIEKVEKARTEWEEKQKKAKEEEKKKKEEGKKEPPAPGEKPKPEEKPKQSLAMNGNGEEEKPKENAEAKKEEKKEEKFEPPPIDPKHKPLVDLIQKKDGASMMVRIASASDLLHLDDVLDEFEEIACNYHLAVSIRRFRGRTLTSSDLHLAVEKLGERKANVGVTPVINEFPYTLSKYNLMARLESAGCNLSALPYRDNRDALLQTRPSLAQTVREGLSREAALKALTVNPASMIGLEKQMGSIEKGKDADLVFLDGDPLDPLSKVRKVMILGELVWEADDKE